MGEWQRPPHVRTKPGTIDAQDLADAINPIDNPEPYDGDLDSVIDLAIGEMGVRLRDNPHEVPAHVLKGILAEANKAAERRANVTGKDEAPNVLDAVEKLPAAHARTLLDTEIHRTESTLVALRQKRKELE